MACCAFAVFLIGQLYLVCSALAGRLGLSRAARACAGAADWRPGGESVHGESVNNGVQPASSTRSPLAGRRLRWSFLVVLIISMGALGVAIDHSLQSGSNWRADLLAASSWCRSSLIVAAQ